MTFVIDTNETYIAELQMIESKAVLVNETDTDYVILNCDQRLYFSEESSVCGRINALVLKEDTREILAIGPTRPYAMETFKRMYGLNTTVEVTEMIEGLFFQLFWDDRIQKWEIGTHNGIFGNYSFYRMPHMKAATYRTMICQAMGNIEDLNDWKGLDYMDKKTCFHFVLQHPDNHLVFKIETPTIYFIGAFEMHVDNVKNQIRYVPAEEYEKIFPADFGVLLPNVLVLPSDNDADAKYEDIIEKYVSIQEPNTRMGIVIKHTKTGDSVVVINPAYEELQKIRGTHPNILYHYLCMKRMKKTEEFLRLFPQYHEFFVMFDDLYGSLVTKLHQSYLDHFVLKKKVAIHKKYFYHIQQLHRTVFIPSLREGETKVIVKKNVVRKYVEGLEPGHVLHILQHELYLMEEGK
jgi:hypothetical protein